jgi:hypothetical protein
MRTNVHVLHDIPLGAIRFSGLNPIYSELAKSSLLVALLKPDGVLEPVSTGWSRALGCPMSGLVGKRLVSFIDRADVQQAKALFQARSGALRSKAVSFALIGCDGRKRPYEWYVRKDRLDEVLFILGTEISLFSGYSSKVRSLRYSALITP